MYITVFKGVHMIEQQTVKSFFFNILNGMALGIVIALIPGALLGEVFKFLARYSDIFTTLGSFLTMFSIGASLIIGVLAGMNLKFNAPQTVILAGAAFIGSGALKITPDGFLANGMGDLINVLFTLFISAGVIYFIGNRLGSLNIVLLPVLGGIIPGAIGQFILPYSKLVTGALGNAIAHFTELNPLLMTILIATTYTLLLVTPISLVAVATVTSLSGLASGAANLGIVAACYVFLFGALGVNNRGTITALAIGTAKMMMANYFKHPIIAVPLLINGIVIGALGYFMNVQGTPTSAGFGYTGLVGPINSLQFMDGETSVNIMKLAVAYFIVPFPFAYLVNKLCLNYLPGYNKENFIFKG